MQLGDETPNPAASEEPAPVPEGATTDTLVPTTVPELQPQGPAAMTEIFALAEESPQKRRASCASESSSDDDDQASKSPTSVEAQVKVPTFAVQEPWRRS